MRDSNHPRLATEVSREDVIFALSQAAELEHSITCLYLFAAFSLKTHPSEGGVDWPRLERIRHWKKELLSVAREEMTHHGLVLNLLILVGGAPHFQRLAFPHPSCFTPPYTTLELLPFCAEALDRFACYEHLHTPQEDGDRKTIGNLYQGIRNDLERVDQSNPKLFIGPEEHQISNQDLNILPGQFDVNLVTAKDLRSAIELIDRILEHDHFERLTAIQQELNQLKRSDPSFEPARPVAANPSILRQSEDVTVIRHPLTRAAARIFNSGYEVMLLLLSRLYGRSGETKKEVDGLISTAFFPLMTAVIRPLGELLTQMPITENSTQATAGAPFELPLNLPLQPFRRGAWVLVHERLQEMAVSCRNLCLALERTEESWAHPLRSRCTFLHQNLERLATNFEGMMNLREEYVQHMLRRMR